MTKRILFVGEEQSLWRDFPPCVHTPRDTWEAECVRTGAEALPLLEPFPFAAVVTDVQLSDMSGVELLNAVMRYQPRAFRVVVSEMTSAASCLDCLGRAHRHLIKPCEVSDLMEVLEEGLQLETWLPSKAVQGLIGQMRRLPSPPAIYFQIVSEMQTPDVSTERIGDLIARDPAITAKLLQLANSAAFGLRRRLVRPDEAVAYVGMETTKALVLLAHTFSSFDQLRLGGFCLESLRWHSIMTGRFAQRIACLEDCPEEISAQAFAAGLLHDVGKLLFAANLPKLFGQAIVLAREQKMVLWEAETQVFGACHSELGGCLMGIWGLPVPIVEAVALHHYPSLVEGQGFDPLVAVHAANVIAHQAWSDQPLSTQSDLDLNYLERSGLAPRFEDWRHHCLAPVEPAPMPRRFTFTEPAGLR